MSRHQYHSSLLISSLVSAALVSSCGAGGVALDAADQDLLAAPAGSDAPAANDPIVSPQPVLPGESKDASDWFDFPDFDLPDFPGFDFDTWWEALHIPVASGENALPVDEAMLTSADVSVVPVITGWHDIGFGIMVPELGDGLLLQSAPGAMSYAMYGLSGIPDGEDVVNVHLQGVLTTGVGDQHGVWIGLSNYGQGAYKWYGPYDMEGDAAELGFINLDTTSASGHAYLVIAVYGGDELAISNLDATIGERMVVTLPEFDLPEIPDFSL